MDDRMSDQSNRESEAVFHVSPRVLGYAIEAWRTHAEGDDRSRLERAIAAALNAYPEEEADV